MHDDDHADVISMATPNTPGPIQIFFLRQISFSSASGVSFQSGLSSADVNTYIFAYSAVPRRAAKIKISGLASVTILQLSPANAILEETYRWRE